MLMSTREPCRHFTNEFPTNTVIDLYVWWDTAASEVLMSKLCKKIMM